MLSIYISSVSKTSNTYIIKSFYHTNFSTIKFIVFMLKFIHIYILYVNYVIYNSILQQNKNTYTHIYILV